MTGSGTAPSAILFDLDGTLIDTFHLYLESYRRALEPVLGFTPTVADFATRKPSSERRFLSDWIGEERAADCHAAMCHHYADLHSSLCEGLYDGVREMLAGLRSSGIPLGIVTGKGRKAWNVTTEHLDLGSFDVVVTDDEAEHPKPHPGGLRSAAAEMGMEPSEIVYLGDSAADMEAGRAAGMHIGAALWPKTAPGEAEDFMEQISKLRPDWAFERPGEVVRVFARWC